MQSEPQFHRFGKNAVNNVAHTNFIDEICNDLSSEQNVEYNNQVQAEVNKFKLYGNYIDDVPQMLISLYLGPLSGNTQANKSLQKLFRTDFGRKPLMLVPFLGHILSGSLMILNVIYTSWDARLLWLSETYIFFGGYSLLSIAM